ncbi:hypothetical protein GAO09_00900 [Rhizobiales bacterium RZME27]|jgi:hypothetical protein|uniref:Transmembrane anchored protein n=1 Tax=Endobacterium cereale TaxID=2663029 RepID=A0A6A8A179_9HYPH|nr:hypothetical protein [Endobacterium cereale]MEB2843517.1 hypothetical protein [Endobacterium cereale]MQY44632.1 hypothetical protein [Endobacterium cereale]
MAQQDDYQEPLISNRMAFGLMAGLGLMVAATFAISLGGQWIGPRLALGSHTDSREEVSVRIGQDELRLPVNTIRFGEQRRSGDSDRIDLYLTWPEMQGYSVSLKNRFDGSHNTDGLIFLQLSQSTMSRDMSGRVEPIYSRLFDGDPLPGPYGLTAHHLRADSGYGQEVILTAPMADGGSYAVRCLMPSQSTAASSRSAAAANSASCQRDIRAGQDLTVLYRFSPSLLRDWQRIDAAIARFVRERATKRKPAQ